MIMDGLWVIHWGLQLFWGWLCLAAFRQSKPQRKPIMSSALRDTLRGKVFAAKRNSKLVPIGTPEEGGEQQYIEVMQPRVGDMLDGMEASNSRQRIARMIIDTCYVPGTNEKVFEEADFEGLMDLPADSTYSALMEAITANISPAKQEAEAKK